MRNERALAPHPPSPSAPGGSKVKRLERPHLTCFPRAGEVRFISPRGVRDDETWAWMVGKRRCHPPAGA